MESAMGNDVKSRLDNANRTGSLQFSGLKLTKIPDEVKKVATLRIIDLSSNKIRTVDTWIGLLQNIKLLNLSENRLSYLPVEVTRLTKLETLLVSKNTLRTLTPPSSISNFSALTSLRTVDLSCNCLVDFPVELCTSTIPLDHLNLSNNQISVIPTCVEALQTIELNLNENKVDTISESISRCPRLKVLRLAHNAITIQAFPMSILENSTVSLLALEDNPLQIKALQELPAYSKVSTLCHMF
ncbi:unnamed protein product [Schistocephalus solidus]|uniref:Leucine-rich repeat-containing protein 57 n=1 Tax=Schistocephalus solidus TaxID=70667 RepID=A0A183SLC0_SCHSO|nr:unnamed protein product [Schistocephalus solidus]